MKLSRRWMRGFATAIVVLLVAVAVGCGQGSPTAQSGVDGDAAGAAAAGGGQSAGLEKVLAELTGLEGEERRARLVELAKAEEDSDAPFNHYTSMNLDNSQPIVDSFQKKYDISQELYRATGTTIVQRVTQESKAKYKNGSDVVSLNGTEIAMLDKAGVLAPFEVSSAEDLAEVHERWVSNYLNVFIAAWNTNLVKNPPTSWTDVLEKHEGKLSLEVGDFDWFGTLVSKHLVAERGMTEEQAVDLVRKAAKGAYTVDGHTVQNQLLASGEFGLAGSVYLHNTLQQIEDGAPLEWKTPAPVQPLIVRSNGIGINAATDRPATALLFIEFMVDDAQEQIASFGRTPANRTAPGGIPKEYKTINVDLEQLLNEEGKWRPLYEEVTRDATIKDG